MADESGQEQPSQLRLTTVDREIGRNLTTRPNSPLQRMVPDFYKSQNLLDELLGSGHLGLPREQQTALYLGVGITGALLAESQPKTGGIIPQEINKGAVTAALVSLNEAGKTGGISAIEELFDRDKELFLALTQVAVTGNDTLRLLEGGWLLLKIYDHILEGERMEKQFPT